MGLGIAFTALVLAAGALWLTLLLRSRQVHAAAPAGESRRRDDARLAKVAALLLLGVGVAFFLLFAIAEMAGGDVSGVQHLLPAAALGALLWLGAKRPRRAGIVLLALSVPLGIAFIVGIAVEGVRPGELWLALLLPLVPLFTALLLLRGR